MSALQPAAHGNSYKQMYFERNLQDAIEQWVALKCPFCWLGCLFWKVARHAHQYNSRQMYLHMAGTHGTVAFWDITNAL